MTDTAPVKVNVAQGASDDPPDAIGLSQAAAAVTAAGFAIGVLYNIGYFTAIDLRLFPLLSYRDHLETLVIFLPAAAVPVVIFVSLRSKRSRQRRVDQVMVVLAVVTLTGWIERDEIIVGHAEAAAVLAWAARLAAFAVVSYCMAVLLAAAVLSTAPFDDARIRVIALSATGALIFVVLLGNVSGHIDAAQGGADVTVMLASDGGTPAAARPARLVRIIDGGLMLVYKDAPRELAYVRNEGVRLLTEPLRP